MPTAARLRSYASRFSRKTPLEAELLTLRAPGSGHPLFARRGTSDRAAFEHVFGGAYAFDLPAEPRLILDLGANVGYASVYFALRYAGVRVLAVEPERSNVTMLRRNVAPFPQIEVVEGAVWPRRGRLAMEDVGKGYWGMRVRAARGLRRGVRAVTIPELLERAGADRVDLAKIDIEGGELELFSAHTEWLAVVDALAIELHDRFRPGCREAVERALARTGARYSETQHGEAVVIIRDDLRGAKHES